MLLAHLPRLEEASRASLRPRGDGNKPSFVMSECAVAKPLCSKIEALFVSWIQVRRRLAQVIILLVLLTSCQTMGCVTSVDRL